MVVYSNLLSLSIKILAIDSKNNHAYQAAGEGGQEVSTRGYMPEEGTAQGSHGNDNIPD